MESVGAKQQTRVFSLTRDNKKGSNSEIQPPLFHLKQTTKWPLNSSVWRGHLGIQEKYTTLKKHCTPSQRNQLQPL